MVTKTCKTLQLWYIILQIFANIYNQLLNKIGETLLLLGSEGTKFQG